MKGKASDICSKCKHCLGMTPQGMYSCGKPNDGSELNIGIDVVLNCANFECKDGKVEGKVSDWCPKCKNCKGMTRESNGVHVWLTEVECKDPYDGMIKTLDADSDVCCSMFKPKPACEKCERFDGTYCHSPEGIFVTSYVSMLGDYTTTNCPWYSEKKEKEPFDLNMSREGIKAIAKLIDNIKKVIFPQEEGSDYAYSYEEILNKVKDLKVYEDENKSMYEDLKYWRERCHGAETDVTTLNSKVETLKNKNNKLNQTISDQEITIKALLITIKEMCKEENENA